MGIPIQKIYDDYRIPSQLRAHMFRVASVGVLIARAYQLPDDDVDEIRSALLLHDMGNIIKFNLEHFPQFLEPQGLAFWQEVQRDYCERYGADEHRAHVVIARELGASLRVCKLIDMIEFKNVCLHCDHDNLPAKICMYADLRVGPFGVISLDERLEDGRKRYGLTAGLERWDLVECVKVLETQIFQDIGLDAESINDKEIALLYNEMEQSEVL